MYLKRGQLYVPDYNQVLSVLCPAPFLRIPEGFDHHHLSYALPTPMASLTMDADDFPKSAVVRCAEFRRKRLFLMTEYLDAWECMEDGR